MTLYAPNDDTGREEWMVIARFLLADPRPDLRTLLVRPQHFTDPRCRTMLERALAKHEAGEKFEPWDLHPDPDVIREVTDSDVWWMQTLGVQIRETQRRIIDRWRVRTLKHELDQMVRRLADNDPVRAIAELEKLVALVRAGGLPQSREYRDVVRDLMRDWFDHLKENADAKDDDSKLRPLIPLPLHALAQRYGGLQPGKTYLIGAVTSAHKTTLARMCWSHAGDVGYRGMFWTMEDECEDVIIRDLAEHSRAVSTQTFTRYELSQDEMHQVIGGVEKRASEEGPGRLLVYDEAVPTLSRVVEVIACESARGLDLVVLDFLQLIRPDNSRIDEVQHLFQCVTALSGLAKLLKIALVITVQPTHAATKAHEEFGKPISIGDLRGGSAIAQAAWAVLLLSRPFDREAKRPLRDRIRLSVAKWKHASTGSWQFKVRPDKDLITDEIVAD